MSMIAPAPPRVKPEAPDTYKAVSPDVIHGDFNSYEMYLGKLMRN
jgi:hypothetical protein